MAKTPQKFYLIVEDFDRNVNTEVVDIVQWGYYGGLLVVETENPGTKARTETVYHPRNFRTLTVQPVED